MAVSSGSLNSTAYGTRYLTFSWSVQSRSIENNTTTIYWELKGAGGTSPGYYTSGNFKVVIDGEQAYYSSKRIHLYNYTLVASGTKTFNHDIEGNKSFSTYIEAGIYTVAVNVTGSGSWELPQIARASNPSISGNYILGNNITINTNRASSSFTHTLRYVFGSASGTIATGVGASTTWTIPKTLANQIPNGTSSTLTIYCDTYNSSILIGTKNTSITVSIPDTTEFKPMVTGCSFGEAVSGISERFNGFVQSRSKLNVTASGSGAYGSTIKNYSVAINGATYLSNNFTTGFLLESGTLNCVVSVTDSRNRSASKTYTYNVLAYNSPTYTLFKVERCDEDGTLDDEGSNAIVEIAASISSVNNNNTKSFKLLYKKQSEESYTTIELSNSSYELNANKIISNIDADFEYDFKLEITDFFATVSKEIPLSTAFTLMDFNASGRGMAIGKVSTKNALEVNMPIYDRFDTLINNGLAYYKAEGDEDPNTTLEELILTHSENGPLGNTTAFFYIRTMFYQEKSLTANRTQVAFPYTTGRIATRYYYNGKWSNWTQY